MQELDGEELYTRTENANALHDVFGVGTDCEIDAQEI